MSSHVHAQKEFDHIKSMIFYLERHGAETFAPTSAVVEMDYWRTRICAMLTLADTQSRIRDQAAILLAKLDRAAPGWHESIESRQPKAAA